MDDTSRFVKQLDLMPPLKLSALDITVVGVGAIGRQVAMLLGACGARRLRLVDFDTVDETNRATQLYLAGDVGLRKTAAVYRQLRLIDAEIAVELVGQRFHQGVPVGDVVFSCVDSVDARREIWNQAQDQCRFWCDGRMLAEVMRVLVVAEEDPEAKAYYASTLFPDQEMEEGRCTARGAVYTAYIIAGVMVYQLARWLREKPPVRDQILTLNSMDWHEFVEETPGTPVSV